MKTPSPHSWLAHGSAVEDRSQWKHYTMSVAVTGLTPQLKSRWPEIAASFLKNTSRKQKPKKERNK